MPNYKSWPFNEAAKLLQRVEKQPRTTVVRFETGFGPSGLPHIGTFAEVARTTWVRHAFETLSGRPTQLIAFSDDMDGLRKVPLNVPQREMLRRHLGKPLCRIPDPFGCCDSYSGHMNNKLQEFLDTYGFDYHFQSSQEAYRRGDFNEGLSILLAKVEEVRAIILPTLGEENREAWSPFFPICESCGRVYSTHVVGYYPEQNEIEYICDGIVHGTESCGHRARTSIFNGKVKVGWKIDWALRWYTYEIAYEMYGKDLIESAKLSSRIVRLMGKSAPIGLVYEMFLDKEGKKISKSVGKGLTVDAWVSYAPVESLLYYIFQNPRKAKRLYWDIVPRCVDDYLADLQQYSTLDEDARPDSAIWHVHNRGHNVPAWGANVNYATVSNLISALGSDSPQLVIEYLERYDPLSKDYPEIIGDLVGKALNYYRDFVLPAKSYRKPTEEERALFMELRDRLLAYEGKNEDELQAIPFDVAREHGMPPSEFFRLFYEVVLGQDRGPRFGGFALLLGKDRLAHLIEERALPESGKAAA